MIGNLLNILLGLWLAYSAIFANPAGAMNNVALAAAAVAVIIFAVWARPTDRMRWQSATNIVLGVVLLLVAATRWAIGVVSSGMAGWAPGLASPGYTGIPITKSGYLYIYVSNESQNWDSLSR